MDPAVTTFPPVPAAKPDAGQASAAPLSASLTVVPATDVSLLQHAASDARLFINRELSWLAFNERVLEEAVDPQVPALERFKVLAIVACELDEVFKIRVA